MKMIEEDITINRGEDYIRPLLVTNDDEIPTPINVSTAVFAGEIRDPNAAVSVAVATFLFELEHDGTDGEVQVSLSRAETLKLKRDKFYTYDWFMKIGDTTYKLAAGEIILNYNTTGDASLPA